MGYVQWRLCNNVWHTYYAMVPAAEPPCQGYTTITSGQTSAVLISPRGSEQMSKLWDHEWVSNLKKSVQDQCTQGRLWLYSSQEWTNTPSVWWGGGISASLSATSARPHIYSQKAWQRTWSNMGTMISSLPSTRANTLVPWGLASIGISWGHVGGLAWDQCVINV